MQNDLGGDATCSEPKRLKSGTSDTAPNVPPAGAVIPCGSIAEVLAEARRNAAIEEQLREQPIFTTGEVLLIRGGFFRVKALSEGRMWLTFEGEAGQMLKQQGETK